MTRTQNTATKLLILALAGTCTLGIAACGQGDPHTRISTNATAPPANFTWDHDKLAFESSSETWPGELSEASAENCLQSGGVASTYIAGTPLQHGLLTESQTEAPQGVGDGPLTSRKVWVVTLKNVPASQVYRGPAGSSPPPVTVDILEACDALTGRFLIADFAVDAAAG